MTDTVRYASPDDWAAAMAGEFLHCRELGHSWSAYTASYDASSKTYDRTLVCSSCSVERRQILDRYGEVIRNGYRYPEGYLAKGQMDHVGHKVPRSTFRLAALHRAIPGENVSRRRPSRRLKAV